MAYGTILAFQNVGIASLSITIFPTIPFIIPRPLLNTSGNICFHLPGIPSCPTTFTAAVCQSIHNCAIMSRPAILGTFASTTLINIFLESDFTLILPVTRICSPVNPLSRMFDGIISGLFFPHTFFQVSFDIIDTAVPVST